VPLTLLKIAFLAIMALLLVSGAHYGTATFCGACVVNALLAFSITFDLTSLILNGLTISWFGSLAVLSDAAVQLFSRWASAIQHQESSI
jgi:hypothetical protein